MPHSSVAFQCASHWTIQASGLNCCQSVCLLKDEPGKSGAFCLQLFACCPIFGGFVPCRLTRQKAGNISHYQEKEWNLERPQLPARARNLNHKYFLLTGYFCSQNKDRFHIPNQSALSMASTTKHVLRAGRVMFYFYGQSTSGNNKTEEQTVRRFDFVPPPCSSFLRPATLTIDSSN